LAYYDGKKLSYGKPLLKNVAVNATVQKQGKNKKLIIFRTKQKSN
jgi:ribosomal protein L21